MAGIPGSAPRERKAISEAYLSLIAVAFSELRRDLRDLIETEWEESIRRRAEELTITLSQACQRQKLDDLVKLLRYVANLTRVSRENALPILPELKEKFESLIGGIQTALSRRSSRYMG